MSLRDLDDSWVGEMVVVVVANDYCVDDGDIFDLARHLCVALWAEPAQRRAAVLEDWVEEDAEAGGKLDIVAGVP